MDFKDHLVIAFSVVVLGLGAFVVSAQTAVRQCTSEECACEEALRQNTVEALEDFLRKYPQSVNGGDTACAAVAVPPGDGGVVPQGQSHDDNGSPKPASTPSEG